MLCVTTVTVWYCSALYGTVCTSNCMVYCIVLCVTVLHYMVPKLCNINREYCTPISLVETLLHSKVAWHTHEKYDKSWHLQCITKCTKQWLRWTSLSKSLSASVRLTELRWLNGMQFRRAVTERIALWSWRDWVWWAAHQACGWQLTWWWWQCWAAPPGDSVVRRGTGICLLALSLKRDW